jgi:hypothetical protein
MKKLVFVVSFLATLLLALEKIGGQPVAPGPETNFAIDATDPQAWRLSADKGRMTCCLELAFKELSDRAQPAARITSGVDLSVHHTQDKANLHTIRLAMPDAASARGGLFEWPPSEAIELRFADAPAASQLVDWKLYVSDDEADTLGKQRWRRQWFWISCGLLVLSVATALYTGWPSKPPRTGDAAYRCTEDIIESIDGPSEKRTRQMRTILRKLCLENAPRKEAVGAAGIPRPADHAKVLLDATESFDRKLETLIQALSAKRLRK